MAVLSTLPPTALPALKQVHALLHLTHHRNKNQHRLAKWWGALSMLRRNVDKLVLELEALESLGTGKTAKKERREAEAKVQQRVEFLRDVLVERTYL
jgi:ribonuclease MRP protein subunit RMP1